MSGENIFGSLQLALDWIKAQSNNGCCFIIGGAQLYNEALRLQRCTSIFLTLVTPPNDLKLTTFINEIPHDFKEDTDSQETETLPKGEFEENGCRMVFKYLVRI